MLDFKEIYEMFNQMGRCFFPEGKVKSDVCARAVLRGLGRHLPRKGFYGWNLRPLPEGWQKSKFPAFSEFLMMVGAHLQAEKEEGNWNDDSAAHGDAFDKKESNQTT